MENNNTNNKKNVIAYLHTHWDREWYREFEEFRIRLIEVFDDVLKKLESNEIDSFYFDGQTLALEDYLQIKPEKENSVKKFIKEKRLFIGPYYCSTDSFLVDAESLIKNLQIGINYSDRMGCKDFIAYHADTFGHSKHISQIIKYFGINNAMFWRGLGELNSEFKFNGVNSIYLIEGYFHDYFSANVSVEQKAQMLKRTLDRISKYSSKTLLLPIGADHLCVADNIKEQIKEVNKLLDEYEIELSTPFEYIKKVEDNFKQEIKHEFRDTKRNFILPGVLSSRIDLKQQNSKHQWYLSRVLQPLNAICTYLSKSKSYQKELDYAYKLLIDNHPHDSIYGCSIDNVHKENKMRFMKLSAVSHAIYKSIERNLKNSENLAVMNLSNYDYNGAIKFTTTEKPDAKYNAQLIRTYKGFPDDNVYPIDKIPVTEDYTNIKEYLIDVKNIPAMSAKNLQHDDINNDSTLEITKTTIENKFIKLSMDNGKITIEDKNTGKQYNNFIQFIDRADIGDSYNFGPLDNDKPIESKILNTKIIENGHIRAILQIEFEIGIPQNSGSKGRSAKIKKHKIKTNVILENQNDYLEFAINWENKSKDHILQIQFNMNEEVKTTYSEDLAGFIKRDFDPKYNIYDYIPAPRGIELKHNTAPMQKCLWAQELGIITEGLQEYEVNKNKLRLTLLRATGTISNPQNPSRGTPAGPPLPTPDLQLIGERNARLAISFASDIESLQPSVEKFYNTTLAVECDIESTKFIDTKNKNILISTIKVDDNSNLIARFINKSNKAEKLDFSTTLSHNKIYYTDAMENITEEYKPQNIEPNSFVTVKICK